MSILERYLTLWVALCIIVGIGLGQVFPDIFQIVGRIEAAHINIMVFAVAPIVALLAVPILTQVFVNSGLAYVLIRQVGSPRC